MEQFIAPDCEFTSSDDAWMALLNTDERVPILDAKRMALRRCAAAARRRSAALGVAPRFVPLRVPLQSRAVCKQPVCMNCADSGYELSSGTSTRPTAH